MNKIFTFLLDETISDKDINIGYNELGKFETQTMGVFLIEHTHLNYTLWILTNNNLSFHIRKGCCIIHDVMNFFNY